MRICSSSSARRSRTRIETARRISIRVGLRPALLDHRKLRLRAALLDHRKLRLRAALLDHRKEI
jgi:hypothetical protein